MSKVVLWHKRYRVPATQQPASGENGAGSMSSSIDSVTIHSGVTALTLRRRLVKAWRALLAPVASHAAVIQYAESATRVTVGDEGCIVIGGRLDLGPGSIIYSRHGGGFVIEMPSAAEAEATGA